MECGSSLRAEREREREMIEWGCACIYAREKQAGTY